MMIMSRGRIEGIIQSEVFPAAYEPLNGVILYVGILGAYLGVALEDFLAIPGPYPKPH